MDLAHQENKMKRCSVLRDFVNSIDYNESLNNLKSKSMEHIRSNHIFDSDKHKMCVQISLMKSKNDLIRYLFNALLKYEGHGVI